MGLIRSVRPQFESFRYYDEAAIERLHQIMILRKMQISVKDIVQIYENPEISTIVKVFTDKMEEIDNEVTALSELKSIINTFLRKMIANGIKKISALPLLYEEMEKQIALMEEEKVVTHKNPYTHCRLHNRRQHGASPPHRIPPGIQTAHAVPRLWQQCHARKKWRIRRFIIGRRNYSLTP